ncbi:hypothetical protein TNCV_1689061 [Trichonephila clavipes]|nr:hypothetical protein TNCV_1689061 [Trichonephila clavipes]
MNCDPLPHISLRGRPYHRSTSISILAQFSAMASARAKSSTHLVLVSSTIKIHFLPVGVSLRGPKKSQWPASGTFVRRWVLSRVLLVFDLLVYNDCIQDKSSCSQRLTFSYLENI